MKTHVDIGADILSSIDFPYPVVPIVRAHHEQLERQGLSARPARRRDSDRRAHPVGGRLLRRLDLGSALSPGADRRGRARDHPAGPRHDVRPGSWSTRSPGSTARSRRRRCRSRSSTPCSRRIRGTAAAPAAARGGARAVHGHRATATAAAPAELLAFVSLARLAAGTPTLADIGALAGGHLRHVAPGATVALFGLDSHAQPAHRAVRHRAGGRRGRGPVRPAGRAAHRVGRRQPARDAQRRCAARPAGGHADRRCGRACATAAGRRRRAGRRAHALFARAVQRRPVPHPRDDRAAAGGGGGGGGSRQGDASGRDRANGGGDPGRGAECGW